MDIYGSQSDFENHVNFTHDINPGNGPAVSPVDSGNGFGTRVFWTAVIPNGDVQVNPLTGKAEMHVHNLPELDYYSPAGTGDLASVGPTWQMGYFPATLNLDVVWNGPVTRRVNVQDAANGFAGLFNENQATVTWSVSSDSGFRFTSNPGNFSTSVPEVPGVNGVTAPLNFFAEVGFERNGIFFPQGGSSAADSVGQVLAALAIPGERPAAPLPSNPGTVATSLPATVEQALATGAVPGESLTHPDWAATNEGNGAVAGEAARGLRGARDRAFQLVWDPAAVSDALFTEVGKQGGDVFSG
jgi:hypothetical protein